MGFYRLLTETSWSGTRGPTLQFYKKSDNFGLRAGPPGI
jgi:hypothetical protein